MFISQPHLDHLAMAQNPAAEQALDCLMGNMARFSVCSTEYQEIDVYLPNVTWIDQRRLSHAPFEKAFSHISMGQWVESNLSSLRFSHVCL